jgi:hypothetical protein
MLQRSSLIIGLAVLAFALGASAEAQAVEQARLGAASFTGPYGEGFGTIRPHVIYNGGDPSGLIDHIRWRNWGGSVAYGTGMHAIFKPNGGYYRHRVRALLRVRRLEKCEGHLAYSQLSIKEPRRPGGKPGGWYSWSGASTICEPPY